jgi:8-oxo-dGTP diphosphatase
MTKAVAKVLVVNDAGEILALRRSMTDENRPGGWDFPGGGCDPGEGFTAAVRREALEEAGITLRNPFIAYSKSEMRDGQAMVWVLYIEYVLGRPEVTLSFEHDHYEWLTPEQFLQASNYLKHHEIITFLIAQKLLTHNSGATARVTGRSIVLNSQGNMLLLRRSASDTFFGGKWDLPGGRAEQQEEPHQTAIRETQEECGIDIHEAEAIYALTLVRDTDTVTWIFYRGHASDDAVTLSWEHDSHQWIDPRHLPDHTDYEVLLRMHTYAMAHRLLAA